MIWQLYYAALRVVSPLALVILHIVSRVTGLWRVRVVLQDNDDRVLLVVNALGDQRWTLPGGGVGLRESLETAARREIHEELHIDLSTHQLRSLGHVQTASYIAPLYAARLTDAQVSRVRVDRWEIYRAEWYTLHDLPADRQPLVSTALEALVADTPQLVE